MSAQPPELGILIHEVISPWLISRPPQSTDPSYDLARDLSRELAETLSRDLNDWRARANLAQLRGGNDPGLPHPWLVSQHRTLTPVVPDRVARAATLLAGGLILAAQGSPPAISEDMPRSQFKTWVTLIAELLSGTQASANWGGLQAMWAVHGERLPAWTRPRTDLDPTPQLRECLALLKLLPTAQASAARQRWEGAWTASTEEHTGRPGQITIQSWQAALGGAELKWSEAETLTPWPGGTSAWWRRRFARMPGSHRLPRPAWLPELPSPPELTDWHPHLGLKTPPRLNGEARQQAQAYVRALEDAAEAMMRAGRSSPVSEPDWFDLERGLINQVSVSGAEAPLRWALSPFVELDLTDDQAQSSLPAAERAARAMIEALHGWIGVTAHRISTSDNPSSLRHTVAEWTVGGHGTSRIGTALHPPCNDGDDHHTEDRATRDFRLQSRRENPELPGFWAYLMAAGLAGAIVQAANTLTAPTLEVARTRLCCQLIAGDIHSLIAETVFQTDEPGPLNWGLLRTCDVQALLHATPAVQSGARAEQGRLS